MKQENKLKKKFLILMNYKTQMLDIEKNKQCMRKRNMMKIEDY